MLPAPAAAERSTSDVTASDKQFTR
jgi:hypothetical protein